MDPISAVPNATASLDMKVTLSEMAKAARGQALQAAKGALVASPTSATFGAAMTEALGRVSSMQKESTTLSQEFQLGNPDVGLEQTVIAAQKAQIAFQAALQVRNRVVQAYQEIMQMNV